MIRIDHFDNPDDWSNPNRPYACEAMKACVIKDGFDITDPVFFSERPCDVFTPTAVLAQIRSQASSSSTTPTPKLALEEIKARFDNIRFDEYGQPQEIVKGLYPKFGVAVVHGDSGSSSVSDSKEGTASSMPLLIKYVGVSSTREGVPVRSRGRTHKQQQCVIHASWSRQ